MNSAVENTSKTPKDSKVEMREIVMPNHINPNSVVFGGVVLSWIDLAAAMCATRHCQSNVVTIHVDSVSFYHPIKLGEHVVIMASVNYVGDTSLIVGVKVISENPMTGETKTATNAYLTFVSLDEEGRKKRVPRLVPEDEVEIRRFKEAQQRLAHKKQAISNSK